MENILQVTNNQATVSTLVIAEHTDKDHKNLRELIEDNISDFNEFGILEPFISKSTSNMGKPIKSYFLNEEQYSLLMTYLRNNPKIKEFKKNMVKAFFEMKKQLENKSSNTDLKALEIVLKELEKQNQEIQNLKNQLSTKKEKMIVKPANPFAGFYENKNRPLGQRENEYLYSRNDWMMLLNECETQLALERTGKGKTLLLSRGAK